MARQENLSPGLDRTRTFSSSEDYALRAGTKLKALVNLVTYFQVHGNNIAPVLGADGIVTNGDGLEAVSEGSTLLIYCNWLPQVHIIKSVRDV
jgi:hypothetical protein